MQKNDRLLIRAHSTKIFEMDIREEFPSKILIAYFMQKLIDSKL